MNLLRSITAWYPGFPLGCQPRAVECSLSLVEANGKRYLKTPFAFLDAFADDDPERQIGRGYYTTEAECAAYLAAEYPWWELAAPLMDALCEYERISPVVGGSRLADRLEIGRDMLYKLALGHKSCPRRQVRMAVAALRAVATKGVQRV